MKAAYACSYGLQAQRSGNTRPARETILSNCAHQIFFATNNAETQKYISAACGERAVKSKSVSKGRGFSTEKSRVSISEKIMPLIRPHEVNTFGADKQIILVEKNHPVKCKKITYYKEKAFKPMLMDETPTPDLIIEPKYAPKFNIPKATPKDFKGGKSTKKKRRKEIKPKKLNNDSTDNYIPL